jgi:sensor histidine kinase YesM
LGGRHIVRYNPDKNTFDYYTDWNKKLAKMGIANLTFDSRGGLWAGTFNEGLAKYNPKTDKFEAIFEQYLKDKPTYFLGQISEKYFAIGDDLNIYIIDLDELYKNKQEKIVKILNYHNGFMGIEPSQNGFYKASDGKIWVCMGTVLSYFDPKQINFTESPLRTYIRKINDQRLPFDYENLATIELEKDINEVRINVESVGEDKSAYAQFSYRIKGFQVEWSPWQTDRTIYLTNMPQGEFTIEVRSQRSNIANGNHPITHLTFRVNIPFWKSPVFYKYAFLLFLILGSILSLIWYKNINQGKRLSQQKRLSEEQERKIKLLQIQTTQAQLNPHFIFNVLQTLQGQIRTNQRSLASENIVKLAHLIRSFLNASIIDNKQTNSILALEITLEKEIDLIKTYIEFEQEQKDNFDFEIIESPTLNVANFSIQPLLIQPFVENAIKHGFHDAKHRGKLIITFSEEDEILMCVIDDNGIGRKRSEEIQSKSLKKYKSLGTELVKKRIEILNQVGYDVQINTIDKLEGGTRVIISIDYIGK